MAQLAEATEAKTPARSKRRWVLAIIGLAVFLVIACAFVLYVARSSAQVFFIPSAAMKPTLMPGDHILVSMLAYSSRNPERGDVVVFTAPPQASYDKKERAFIERVVAIPGDTVRITPGYVMIGSARYSHADLQDVLRSSTKPGGECLVKLTSRGVLIDGQAVSSASISRSAGKPGAAVKVVPGVVYINGKQVNEPYVAEDPSMPYPVPTTNRDWVTEDQQGNKVVKIPEGRLLVMGDNRNDSNDSRFWGLLERSRVRGKAIQIVAPAERSGAIR